MIFPAGQWVAFIDHLADPETDRVGLVVQRHATKTDKCYVKFGADGPTEVCLDVNLRFATNEEIADKTGEPVQRMDQDRDNLQDLGE